MIVEPYWLLLSGISVQQCRSSPQIGNLNVDLS